MQKKTLSWKELEDKVGILIGTRPGIVKMSPLVHEYKKRKFPFFIVHSGQHYSLEMDQAILHDVGISPKDIRYHLIETKNFTSHGDQTAQMLTGIEKALLEERPKYFMICGDANTNLAGALAARKLNIGVAHVEAGLRSHDWRMPEEHNRIMIDHISEILFAPTQSAADHLKSEMVRGLVVVTGNTVVDATFLSLKIAKQRSEILKNLGIERKLYAIITSHREETVDLKENIILLVDIIKEMISKFNIKIVFPVHPRTHRNMVNFGMWEELTKIKNLLLTPPAGYLDFLKLLNESLFAITDSGGVQEEACILQVPCITIRKTTERPETVEVGANIVTDLSPPRIMAAVSEFLGKRRNWLNPFGDGNARKYMVNTILENLGKVPIH